MKNVIRIGKHLVPVERIALFETFTPPIDPPLRSDREFKARVVLLDRSSILSEDTPERLSADHGFRFLNLDRVGANPAVGFRIETFTPAESFTPTKAYLSRLTWTDQDGNTQSKLLLTAPEELLAAMVRGHVDGFTKDQSDDIAPVRPRRTNAKRRTKAPTV